MKDRFDELAKKHGVDPEARKNQNPTKLLAYWSDCLDTLKALTVCDPACGSGAFLIRAYEALDAHYKVVVNGLAGAGMPPEQYRAIEDEIPDLILTRNLYGVDLSREGVEISQLALWVRSARVGKTLADLSKNIVHGNSLVSDKNVDPHALDWHATFPPRLRPRQPGRVFVRDRESAVGAGESARSRVLLTHRPGNGWGCERSGSQETHCGHAN